MLRVDDCLFMVMSFVIGCVSHFSEDVSFPTFSIVSTIVFGAVVVDFI